MNNDNNNQNNYNLNNSMNDDMFNVFNQTPTTEAPVQATPVAPQIGNTAAAPTTTVAPTTTTPPTPPKPAIDQKKDENLITVNNYVEPKEPFSLKNLLKKKVQEEEKSFDINAITNYTETKKVLTEEDKEEKKKKSDLIKLVILLIILAIVGYFAYSVFSNYLAASESVVINKRTATNIVNTDNVKTISYECDKPFDMAFYNFPYPDNIEHMTYKGSITYSFRNEKLYNIEENMTFLYIDLGEASKDVINYCNKYNVVYDQFQLLCKFSHNYLIIKNSIYMKDLDNKVVKNNLYTFNIIYNKDTIIGDILTNDKSCKLKE